MTLREGRDVVAGAATPRNVAEVESVVNTVVGEGREELLVDRIPQPKLRSDASIEEAENVESIGALGSRREPEQLARIEVLEDPFVTRRRRMVELVDDNDVEVLWIEAAEAGSVEALDRREDMLEPPGSSVADPQLTERCVAQRMPVGRKALLEDLLAVRNKQESVTREEGRSRA